MIVRVAIDLALDRLFDYEVPEALQKKLAVGQLLSVPFGHREARGFAMALVDAAPSPRQSDAEVVDAASSPRQSGAEVDVLRSVATRGVSSLGVDKIDKIDKIDSGADEIDVLRSVATRGVKSLGVDKIDKVDKIDRGAGEIDVLRSVATRSASSLGVDKIDKVDKIDSGADAAIAISRISEYPIDAYRRLSILSTPKLTRPKLKPVTAIVDETPFFSPALLALVKRIAAYTAAPIESVLKAALPASVLKKSVRPRELMFIEPALAPSPVPLTKRQQWLYDQIVRLGGGWMAQLCEELKTTPATIKELGRRGLVSVAVRARRRDPLAGRKVLPTKPLALNAEQRAALEAIVGVESGAGAGVDVLRSVATRGVSSLGVDKVDKIDKIENGADAAIAISRISEYPIDAYRRLSILSTPKLTRPLLLHGVTGSGKTEVYLQAIARELAEGRGAIVLVPEIALTPQTVARFASRFGDRVAVLHSALSDGERYDEWHRIRSGVARVVIGPRSAVFAPVKDLGLIVVDEEHEPTYKQEENPRYHARDVAVLRGAIEGARVVLGSATPSLETWRNVQIGKYSCATMTRRAGAGTMPNVLVVDMKEEVSSDAEGLRVPVDAASRRVDSGPSRGAIFSSQLLEAIRARLDRHEQTILFLNRRGYSRSVVCDACGHVMTCDACDLPYTYHRADACLRCHVCGGWTELPAACPVCGARALSYKGIGTQRAEAALKACCPRAAILRMDADSTSRKNSHDDILSAFRRGEADVLLGTQMIAKGLDFPNVTLVGVLNADSSLMMPDFRAAERTYQLLAQVAGRAGRAELPGEVIIQAWDPDAFAIRAAARGDFATFAARELADRAEGWFPPYCHLATVNFRSRDMNLVASWADMYAKSLMRFAARGHFDGGAGNRGRLVVGEAVPSALEKADGFYRWQIVLRADRPSLIVSAWRWITSVRPPKKNLLQALDIDANNLL